MLVRYSFKFNRKKKLDRNGEGLIEMVCYLNRERKLVSTKIRIEPKFWNEQKQEVRRSHPKSDLINSQLEELKVKYYDFEANRTHALRRQERNFRLSDFNMIDQIDLAHNKCFVKFIRKEIELRAKSGSFKRRTLMGYTTFLNNLKKFNETIPFHSMDHAWCKKINEFINKNFNHPGSRWTFVKTLKTFLTAVQNESLLSVDQVLFIKSQFKAPKVVKQDPEVLTLNEFKQLQNFIPDTVKRQTAYDAFMIGCYTGLRISDVRNLSFEELKCNSENEIYLKVNVIKGNLRNKKKPLILPIGKMFKYTGETKSEPEKILARYAERKNSLRDLPKSERLFFDISEPFVNRYLKEIAKQCNFQVSKLSFHHSRNTYARLLHHYGGMSISLVKELLQHTNIKQTMIYETSNEREREQILGDIDWDRMKF